MNYMVRWGPKGFVVSPTQIVPFNDFSTSLSLKTGSENDTSGTPTINTRGRELRPIQFSSDYFCGLGVDPRGQVDAWEAELGNSYPLYIGNKRFGPAKMMLTKVETSDVRLTAAGDWISCKITVTLKEYSEGTSSALSSSDESAKKAASVYEETVAAKKEALNATASASDKAAKKAKGTRGYTV